MKYTNTTIINLPIKRVIELFDDPDNLKHWQPGLISFELLFGKQGQPGAKSKMLFDTNGQKMEMIETISVRDLPREFTAVYEVKGMWNEVKNLFKDIDGKSTEYSTISEFRPSSFLLKVIVFLIPGSFKKQSQVYLDKFKEFAESQG